MWTVFYFIPQKAKSDLSGLEKSEYNEEKVEKEFSQKALEREVIYQWHCNLIHEMEHFSLCHGTSHLKKKHMSVWLVRADLKICTVSC